MGRGQVGGALPLPPRLGEGLQQAQFLHQTGLESSSIGGEEEWLDFGILEEIEVKNGGWALGWPRASAQLVRRASAPWPRGAVMRLRVAKKRGGGQHPDVEWVVPLK